MIEALQEFVSGLFGGGYLAGFFMSMIPLLELKGSIIFMIAAGENIFLSFLVGVAGTSVIAPVLLFVFMPLVNWAKGTKVFRGIATWLENHFTKKSRALEEKANQKAGDGADEALKRKKIERAKYLGLFIFTAIPLALTGCWTAAIVASILHLDYKKSLLLIVLGNIVAGAAITLLGGVLNVAFFR